MKRGTLVVCALFLFGCKAPKSSDLQSVSRLRPDARPSPDLFRCATAIRANTAGIATGGEFVVFHDTIRRQFSVIAHHPAKEGLTVTTWGSDGTGGIPVVNLPATQWHPAIACAVPPDGSNERYLACAELTFHGGTPVVSASSARNRALATLRQATEAALRKTNYDESDARTMLRALLLHTRNQSEPHTEVAITSLRTCLEDPTSQACALASETEKDRLQAEVKREIDSRRNSLERYAEHCARVSVDGDAAGILQGYRTNLDILKAATLNGLSRMATLAE